MLGTTLEEMLSMSETVREKPVACVTTRLFSFTLHVSKGFEAAMAGVTVFIGLNVVTFTPTGLSK